MFRATAPLSPAEQRAVSDGATRAELPAWIVQTISSASLSHLLLITRQRGDAAFPVVEGFTLGTGRVEGIGYYVDTFTELVNRDTGTPSTGFLGAYAMLRLQLIDAQSGEIASTQDVAACEIHAGRRGAQGAQIWAELGPQEKVEVLRELVQRSVSRVLPALLAAL
jgi:hypothetical protein